MAKQTDRKAGYEAGLMTAGDWLKGRVVGFVLKGDIILRREVELKDGQHLFVATKEEIEERTKGKMPRK